MIREELKKEILEKVPEYDSEQVLWSDIREFMDLVEERDGFRVFDKAIQAALDQYQCVKIPEMGETLYLDAPLIMRGGYKLSVAKCQRLSNIPGAEHCLIRNQNIENGFYHSVAHRKPDCDIVVEGGIWDGACEKGKGCRFGVGSEEAIEGAMAIMIFSNIEQLVVKDAEFLGGGSNYAVQISNVKGFHVSGLTFIEFGRDGVHMNGPLIYGEVCGLKGRDMGDDMVAMNAWDWDTAAITFGSIQYLYVHDNESKNNEFRILPGRKLYEDGYVDCDIHHCVIEGLSGIYTFKMYCQPNIMNAIDKNYHDVSGTVGNIYDVYFKDITIDEHRDSGFASIPVGSVFEVCADCHDIYFEDIRIAYTREEFECKGMHMMNVGPLSATWKNGSEDPEKWGEVFDPDAVCSVRDIYFKNVQFTDGPWDSSRQMVYEINMTLNQDYPGTTPRGGTGYGTARNIFVE